MVAWAELGWPGLGSVAVLVHGVNACTTVEQRLLLLLLHKVWRLHAFCALHPQRSRPCLLPAPPAAPAFRGPARTRVANACLMAHGVLLELRRWAKSAGVLHAAVDCLKQVFKLTSSGGQAGGWGYGLRG